MSIFELGYFSIVYIKKITNEREDFVVTFYNGEYPELYPEKLKQDKKIQDKKIQDKKIQNFNKILEICIEPKKYKRNSNRTWT